MDPICVNYPPLPRQRQLALPKQRQLALLQFQGAPRWLACPRRGPPTSPPRLGSSASCRARSRQPIRRASSVRSGQRRLSPTTRSCWHHQRQPPSRSFKDDMLDQLHKKRCANESVLKYAVSFSEALALHNRSATGYNQRLQVAKDTGWRRPRTPTSSRQRGCSSSSSYSWIATARSTS